MLKNFDAVKQAAKSQKVKKKVAVAVAQDKEVLECVISAREEELADFILVGDEEKIKALLVQLGDPFGEWNIVHETDEHSAAKIVAEMIAKGDAQIPMKGLLHTSAFLRQIFNKQLGLIADKALVSQITVTEYPAEDRLILITDCAINISPGFDEKCKIIKNAVKLANSLGIEKPRVAVIAPVEVVNPNMPECIDASMLHVASLRGQLGNCIVDGPLALDNALSMEAAEAKGITNSEVAGKADILIMPDLAAGNILDKSLRYFAEVKTGSSVVGTKVPLIVTSRSDSAENKLHAVALSVL